MYQRITVLTQAPNGAPGELPAALDGLDDASLANLSAAIDPCPDEYIGQGFVYVDDAIRAAADAAADLVRINASAVLVAAKGLFSQAERTTIRAALAIITAKVPA